MQSIVLLLVVSLVEGTDVNLPTKIEVDGCHHSNYAYWCLDNSTALINCSVPLNSLPQAQLTLKQKCDDSDSIATALQPVGDVATLQYKYLVTNQSQMSQTFVCCYETQSSEVVQVDRTCLEVEDFESMVLVRLSGFRVLYVQANGNLNGTLYYYSNSNDRLLSIDCTQWWQQYDTCDLQSGSKVKFATVNNGSWYYSAEVCETKVFRNTEAPETTTGRNRPDDLSEFVPAVVVICGVLLLFGTVFSRRSSRHDGMLMLRQNVV